jgi:hypothetical protein
MTLSINNTQHNKTAIMLSVTLNVIMLSVTLNVIMLSVTLNVIMLSVTLNAIMLSVFEKNAVMPSVVAPVSRYLTLEENTLDFNWA